MTQIPNPRDNANPVDPANPAGLNIAPRPDVTSSEKTPFPRPVVGATPEMVQAQPQAFVPQTTATFTGTADRPRTRSTITGYLYAGTDLVDGQGRIVRAKYDTTKEAYTELRSMPTTERLAFLNEMYQRGLYDKKIKPSETGLTQADLRVMQDVLLTSNTYGYEWRTALNFIRQENPVTSPGMGRKATSRVDLADALDRAALGSLGRTLTAAERNQQIASIQAQERAGTDVSTSMLVQQAPSQVAPAEEQAYNFARVADLTASILGGS
jgi:hypothetical protein